MNTPAWLLFSYTLPAKQPGGRVRIWRKLAAIGAVQLKGGVQVLPDNDTNREHLEWTWREVEDAGGEALLLLNAVIAHVRDEDVMALFRRARDEDYARLERELRALLDASPADALPDLKGALRKQTRRFEAIREIDFFPSGRGERTARLLTLLAEKAAGPQPALKSAHLDRNAYRGKTWVTREHPYIDRLASFWLARRFIDPEARIEFVAGKSRPARGPDRILFDMSGGDFTHQDGLITFEAMIAAFGLDAPGLPRLAAIIRAIDLKEDSDNDEARAIRDVIDGLVLLARDDFDLVDRALGVLDALHAAYGKPEGEQR